MKLLHRTVKKIEQNFWLVVGGGVVLAMVLCFAIGMQQSVWFDEAYSVLVAKQPLGEVFRLVALDTHPPLYYVLLHSWIALLGSGEAALRLLSVVAYGGSLIVAVALMKKLFGRKAAFITLGLLVVSPLLMRYGFEIRMYSLASLIGVAATYVLVVAREKNKLPWWALYAVLVALGMGVLYNLVYLWAAHALWLLWSDTKAKRFSWKAPWLGAYVGSVLLFLPQLPTLLSQVSNGALAPISQAMTLENILGIVSFNSVYQPVWALSAAVSLVVLAVVGSLVWLVLRSGREVLADARKYLLASYIVVPIGLLTLICLVRPLYVERYLSHIAIGGVMAVGLLVWLTLQRSRRAAYGVYAVFILAASMGVVQLTQVGNFNFQRMQRPNVEQVARTIHCDTATSVVAADPYVATELAYYLDASCPLYFYAPWETLRGGYAPFNNSPRQLKDQQIPALSQTIYYAYYDTPALQLPADYTTKDLTPHDLLQVKKLSVE